MLNFASTCGCICICTVSAIHACGNAVSNNYSALLVFICKFINYLDLYYRVMPVIAEMADAEEF